MDAAGATSATEAGFERARAALQCGRPDLAAEHLRAGLHCRRGALTLPQANAAAELLVAVLEAATVGAARGLSVVLYGQGARQPRLVLQAFSEFIDAGNSQQAARFLPYVAAMREASADLERARWHGLRGEATMARELRLGVVAAQSPECANALRLIDEAASRAPLDLRAYASLAARVRAVADQLAGGDMPGEAGVAADVCLVPSSVLTMDEGVQRQLACRAAARAGTAASCPTAADVLGQVASALLRSNCIAGLEEAVVDCARANPEQPQLALVLARLLRRQLASNDELLAVLAQVPAGAPGRDALRQFVAQMLYLDGDGDRALALADGAAGGPSGPLVAHLQLHSGIADNTQAGVSSGALQPPRRYGPPASRLAAALESLGALAGLPHRHGDDPDADAVARLSAASLSRLRECLADPDAGAFADHVAAAAELRKDAARLRGLTLSRDIPGAGSGPAYGALDRDRNARIYEGLQRHRHELLAHAIGRVLGGEAVDSVPALAGAAEALVDAAIALGDLAPALRLLDALLARSGACAHVFWLQLRERCALSALPPDVSGTPAHAAAGIVASTRHVLVDFEAWRGNGSVCALLDNPAVTGEFESIDAAGVFQTHRHVLPAEQVLAVRMRDVAVRDSWLLLDADGRLLQPPPLYRLSGDFPYASPHLLARGTHGASLSPAKHWKRVEEPVVVLANMDVLHHANYYHWTIHVLPRLAWAAREGVMASHRLLLPAETRPWMDAGLALCGVDETRVLRYRSSEALRISEAIVVSPLGNAPRAILEGLREAATSPPSNARGGLFYLSRRRSLRRTLVNEESLCEIAAAQGFEVICPGSIPVAAQAALFAGSRGVVSPAGAALANMVYAPPGTRTLMLGADTENFPTFIELSIAMQQPHRALLGTADERLQPHLAPDDVPYRIDEERFEAELRWVAGDVAR